MSRAFELEKPRVGSKYVLELLKDRYGATLQYRGFAKNVGRAIQQTISNDDLIDYQERPPRLNLIVPDAYIIDAENKALLLFEIEDRSRLPIYKLSHISTIFHDMDAFNWVLELCLVDVVGREIPFPQSILIFASLIDIHKTYRYATDLIPTFAERGSMNV